MGRRPVRGFVALVLAVALPLLVLTSTWERLQRPPEPTGKAAAMERVLARLDRVDVVVLGSSLARTNVRPDVLAEELGIGERNVVVLTLPNATAAHWYAVLRNRVLGNGHRPQAVLFVGALTTMVTPEVLMDASVDRLVNQLSEDEPVIGRKVFGTDDREAFRWRYAREQAGQLRDALVETWRDLALSVVHRRSANAGAGARLAERANEIVFADDRMDYSLHRAHGTGLRVEAVQEITLDGLDVSRDSLVPDLAALVAEHGGKAVFVRTPFPPSNADNDLVPPAVEDAAVRVMEASGALYVDMRSLNLEDRYYRDMRHMSREGAAIFTRALARTLRTTGALHRASDAAGSLHLQAAAIDRSAAPAQLTRIRGTRAVGSCGTALDVPTLRPVRDEALRAVAAGASPVRAHAAGAPLPWLTPEEVARCAPGVTWQGDQLVVVGVDPGQVTLDLGPEPGVAAHGDAPSTWWVPPGTTLTVTFDTPWPYPDGAFGVSLLGHAFGEGVERVVLRAAGATLPLEASGARVWAQEASPPPASHPWTVELESPPDGPWLLVQNLRVGRAPYAADVIGTPEALAGASIRVVGGRVEDTRVAPVYQDPPPPVDVPGRVRPGPRGVGILPLPRYAALADASDIRAPNPHRCSPLRVVEDGVVLPEPHVTCHEMANLKGGRSCHAGDLLFLSASDGSDPARNGRRYEVVLEPTRVCERLNQRDTTPLRGSLWLYPGDHLVLDLPEERLDTFLDGAARLEYALDPVLASPGDAVTVRLSVGGEVVLEERLEAGVAPRLTRRHALDPPLPPRTRGVRLEVVSESERAWWLLVMAALSEDLPGARLFEAARVPAPPPATPPVTGERPPDHVERWGTPPELPEARTASVRQAGVEATLFPLWPVSNSVLVKEGLGPWSPLLLREGDRVLRPTSRRAHLRQDCGCFLHLGKSVLVPAQGPASAGVEAFLAPEVPLEVDGGEVVWVYPGGGVRLGFDEGWSGEALEVFARVSARTTDRNAGWAPPTLRAAGRGTPFTRVEDDTWAAHLAVAGPGDGPWEIELSSPGGGPYLLLLELVLVDADGARRVVTLPVGRDGGGAEEASER